MLFYFFQIEKVTKKCYNLYIRGVKFMRKFLRLFALVLTVIIVIGGSIMGLLSGIELTELQKSTMIVLSIICGASILYCFVVGELTGNTSQMDKLWSLLPIAYTWVVAIKGGFKARLVVFACVVTLWGIRLTYNFARKGAYKLKFWEGREDYRWAILRNKKPLNNRIVWAIFDLFFIAIYQNVLVLAICFPSVAVMESNVGFGWFDAIVTIVALGFLILELVSDEYQWKFHQTKKKYLDSGLQLEELPSPYNLGFNTTGVWGYMRHPNYLGEQGIWLSLYFFTFGAGVCKYGIFNWTIIGSLVLVLLFIGSSTLGEAISKSKYPKYSLYIDQVSKYLPIKRFDEN